MKVLVIGQGGREHTITWKLSQSEKVSQLYVAPGNGGTQSIAENVPLKETQVAELIQFVKEQQIDLTFVGPENPLADGIVNQFQEAGLRIYGPRKEAAIIEGSKSFAKDLMKKYDIPTARYDVFTNKADALHYLEQHPIPVVIKADGLAAGKGVVVAHSLQEAQDAVEEMMGQGKFGQAGHQVVIEEFLQGEELSLMAFVDGEDVLPMVPAQDHKPVFDGDKGPNTGGMGAYSPVPQFSREALNKAIEQILIPTAKAMVKEGRPFTGILYAGLMMTDEGAKVIEFNARFGDPETQVVLPRLQTDLIDVIEASLDHRLKDIELSWSTDAVMTVILASEGYPEQYPKGRVISGLSPLSPDANVAVFHAGTQLENGQPVTSGGRVLAVTSKGETIEQAKALAYESISHIHFDGMHYRRDIGDKAIGKS